MLEKAFGVCVFIQREDGKILGIARPNDPNQYGLVGGKVEDGESEEQALIRESKEEAGITLSNLKEVYRGKSRSTGHFAAAFTATYSGEPSNQPNEPEIAWLDKEVLMADPFGDFNKDLFKVLGLIKE